MKNQKLISTLLTALMLSASTIINAQVPSAWADLINSTTSNVSNYGAVDMACISTGEVIVAGGYAKTTAYSGIKLSKLDKATGSIISSVVFPSVQNGNDYPAAIAVDASDNIYVTGAVYYNSSFLSDMVILKYNSSLVLQWTQYIYGLGTSGDYGQGIAIDTTGSILVTGYVGNRGTGTGGDIVTAKYSPTGVQQWIQYYTGPGSGNDKPADIKTDGTGNVYVCGKSYSAALNYSFLALKYNSTGGAPAWTKTFDFVTMGSYAPLFVDEATSLAVNSSGVYVTGGLTNSGTAEEVYLVKLSLATGSLLWSKMFGSAGSVNDRGVKVCLDDWGYVYVGGQSNFTATSYPYAQDIFLRRYNSSGTLIFTYMINNTDRDFLANMKVSSTGTIYLTGAYDNHVLNEKHNSFGIFQWRDESSWATELITEMGTCIAIDETRSSVYFGGNDNWYPTRHWMVRKFNPSLKLAAQSDDSKTNLSVNVFPNPATTTLNVASDSQNGHVQLYSIIGNLVAETNLTDSKTQIDVSKLSKGTYLLNLKSEDGQTTTKKVVIK